jgi:hypothetical protein
MRETWYILENGIKADPNEVSFDEKGILRHKSGVAVAYGPHGPRSIGVDDAAAERAKSAGREIKADEPKRGYKTRDMKAR